LGAAAKTVERALLSQDQNDRRQLGLISDGLSPYIRLTRVDRVELLHP
jgi:hypothetical protein